MGEHRHRGADTRPPRPVFTVLRCDDVPEPDRSRHGDTHERTARHLVAAAAELGWAPEIRVCDVLALALPAEDDDSDLYVTTGSATDPDSQAPWVVALRAWIVRALARGARIYGVCFGHQLAAHALGAAVGRGPDWEVGGVEVERLFALPVGGAATAAALVAAQREGAAAPVAVAPLRLLMSHQDAVHSLPEGAALWLRGAFCPIQGMVLAGDRGGALVGVQGHPEFDSAQVSDLYARRGERLGAARVEAAKRSAALGQDGPALTREVLLFLLGDRFHAATQH